MTPTQLHELDVSIARAMEKKVSSFQPANGGACLISEDETHYQTFQPTKNPADAMEVQQWLLTQGHTFFVRSFKHGKGFLFGLVDETLNGETLWVETLPLAICLFAQRIINTNPSK